jgi:hypothetical protein
LAGPGLILPKSLYFGGVQVMDRACFPLNPGMKGAAHGPRNR